MEVKVSDSHYTLVKLQQAQNRLIHSTSFRYYEIEHGKKVFLLSMNYEYMSLIHSIEN